MTSGHSRPGLKTSGNERFWFVCTLVGITEECRFLGGDNDMWAYAYMKGWIVNERIVFEFYDSLDLYPLTDRASADSVPTSLRQRLSTSEDAMEFNR